MLAADYLAILCCPESRSKLTVADDALVTRLNESIAAGRLQNRSGQTLETPLDGALVRADGKIAYPIIDKIPILLADEGIPLESS